jgi:hypothetical protein
VSAERAKSAVEAAHRSIHPNIPGVPSWVALLIAVTATAIGYGIDAGSGHKELTAIFVGLYIAGCVVAVLVVRQDGLFTAVIQPPLILFCAVPGAYWLFHDGKVANIKDLLINCGYPLIERFPLMLGTAGGVLLIGLVRWYFAKLHVATVPASATGDTDTAEDGGARSFAGGIVAKAKSLLGIGFDEDEDAEDAEDALAADPTRTRAAGKRTGASSRSAARSARARSRHARPPRDDEPESALERSRRRRQAAARDYDPAEPPRRPRRRPRPQDDPELRGQPPREARREPRTRRNPYERPTERPMPRGGRFDGYDGYEPPPGAPERPNRYEPYEPPYERPRRRPGPNGTNGADPTHHPISQVRYRGPAAGSEPGAEPRAGRRGRSRRPPSESWEYDA